MQKKNIYKVSLFLDGIPIVIYSYSNFIFSIKKAINYLLKKKEKKSCSA